MICLKFSFIAKKQGWGTGFFLVSVCIIMFMGLALCYNKWSYHWIGDIIVCIVNLICKNLTICIFWFLVGHFLAFGLCAW